tara:strand:+ start:1708 stop:2544 length:837 start_codon:yes stop_codon:yes gene_type:complete
MFLKIVEISVEKCVKEEERVHCLRGDLAMDTLGIFARLHKPMELDAFFNEMIRNGASSNLGEVYANQPVIVGPQPNHPVIFAASRGYTRSLQVLLSHGFNINYHQRGGRSALHWAICMGREETALFITQVQDLTINDLPTTVAPRPLIIATQERMWSVIISLLRVQRVPVIIEGELLSGLPKNRILFDDRAAPEYIATYQVQFSRNRRKLWWYRRILRLLKNLRLAGGTWTHWEVHQRRHFTVLITKILGRGLNVISSLPDYILELIYEYLIPFPAYF